MPTLSGKAAIDRCAAAYRGLKTYQGTTRVSQQVGKARAEFRAYIRYQSPGQFHITGNETGGTDFTIVVDGKTSWVRKRDTGNRWLRSENPMYHIGAMALPTYGAASSIPALLVEQDMLTTLGSFTKVSPRAAEETLDGRQVYRVDAKTEAMVASLWIDPETFLLVQRRTGTRPKMSPKPRPGKHVAPAYTREVYHGVQTDTPFPAILFARPHDAP